MSISDKQTSDNTDTKSGKKALNTLIISYFVCLVEKKKNKQIFLCCHLLTRTEQMHTWETKLTKIQ